MAPWTRVSEHEVHLGISSVQVAVTDNGGSATSQSAPLVIVYEPARQHNGARQSA
jgi:hypothetical protein